MNASSATVHAVALLALPAVLILAAILFRQGPRSWRAIFYPLLGGLFLFFIGICTFHVGSGRGDPVMQLAFGAISFAIAGFGITSKSIRTLVCALAGTSTLILCWHYVNVVDSAGFTGITGDIRLVQSRMHYNLTACVDVARKAGANREQPYPQGWLRDSDLAKSSPDLSALLKRVSGRRVETYPLWHSAFTRIYGRREFPTDIWYPGGPVSEAAGRLEWRDRVSQ